MNQMNQLSKVSRKAAPSLFPELDEAARAYARRSKAENTKRAYRAAWEDFTAWCENKGLEPLPAEPRSVGWYLTARAQHLKTSTLQLRLSAISQAHRLGGYELDTRHPYIKEVWAGIRREKGTAKEGKTPILTDDLRAMVRSLPGSLLGLRDRALLLLGFAGAFRRSELVGLDAEDIQQAAEGLVIQLRSSKTDQEGQGTIKGIPYGFRPETCPVRALQAWLEASGIEEGPIFRSITRHGKIQGRLSGRGLAKMIKRAAKAAGLDPDRFSGHSLRAGFATQAAANGVPEWTIMNQTGHKRRDTLDKYIRMGNLFRQNAAAQVGL
jgi:integrase